MCTSEWQMRILGREEESLLAMPREGTGTGARRAKGRFHLHPDAYMVPQAEFEKALEEPPLSTADIGPQADEVPDGRLRVQRVLLSKKRIWFEKKAGDPPPKYALKELDLMALADPEKLKVPWSASMIPNNPQVREKAMEMIREKQEKGIVRPRNSPYTSMVLLVPKGNDSGTCGSWSRIEC